MKRSIKWFKSKWTISYLAYFVTMGLMGFWHGLTWYYILYGFYHAALLVGYDLFDRWNKQHGGIGKRWGRWTNLASMLVTFNLVCFGLLLFSGHLASLPVPPPQVPMVTVSIVNSSVIF